MVFPFQELKLVAAEVLGPHVRPVPAIIAKIVGVGGQSHVQQFLARLRLRIGTEDLVEDVLDVILADEAAVQGDVALAHELEVAAAAQIHRHHLFIRR